METQAFPQRGALASNYCNVSHRDTSYALISRYMQYLGKNNIDTSARIIIAVQANPARSHNEHGNTEREVAFTKRIG